MTNELKIIADNADMIINGYAFTKSNNIIRILNLKNPQKSTILNLEGSMLETNMDNIELKIVIDYYKRDKKYMED